MNRYLPHAAIACLLSMASMAQAAPGDHFILNWDMDQDGTVTLAELEERRDIVFNMFDNDQNGILDAEEYGFFDETRAADLANNAADEGGGGHGAGGEGGMNRVMDGLTLSFNDLDGDAQVSHAEFIGQTTAWMLIIDRTQDGAIGADDFGRR